MQMQTKRTTSRIPNLHNMSFNLTNHVTKLAHAYPAYLAVSFVERANELRDGPLEKLLGEGNFRAAGIFFR